MSIAEKLARALEPFITHNSSEHFITLTVRTADVTKAREALAAWRSQQAGEVAQEPLGHVLIGSLGLGSFEAGRHPPPGWVGLPGLRAVYTAEQLQAAHESGRQRGMDQANALWELAKDGQEMEAQPLGWLPKWAMDHLAAKSGDLYSVRVWQRPDDTSGLVPIYTSPQAASGPASGRLP